MVVEHASCDGEMCDSHRRSARVAATGERRPMGRESVLCHGGTQGGVAPDLTGRGPDSGFWCCGRCRQRAFSVQCGVGA